VLVHGLDELVTCRRSRGFKVEALLEIDHLSLC
jgi:hypothetical protein